MVSDARRGSRLEVEDPEHCKECGAEIPTDEITVHDEQGRPQNLRSDTWEWVTIERCHDCWAEEKLRELCRESEARYAGEVSGVLRRE